MKVMRLPWKRVHRIPDYAYFNHSVHVNKGIECASCHGNVEDMDGAMQVSEFTMATCLELSSQCTNNVVNYSWY